MTEFMEVVCEKGVLTFDGRVVEVFGFGRQDFSIRIHVATLETLKVNPGGRFSSPFVNFKARNMKIDGMAMFTEEEAASPQVAALIQAVQAAAPNLKA
jgi:hypothetical protein